MKYILMFISMIFIIGCSAKDDGYSAYAKKIQMQEHLSNKARFSSNRKSSAMNDIIAIGL